MMKLLNLFFVATAILGCICALPSKDKDIELDGIFEDLINNTVNGLVEGLPEVITMEELNVPFAVDGVIVGYLNLSNLNIQGIKSLVANYIKVELFTLELNMTIEVPSININLSYDTDVTVANLIPLYGAGKMNINIENLNFGIYGGVNFTDGISLKNIKVILGLGDATFDLHGLINSEDFSALVSAILTDNVAPFINDNAEVISTLISPLLETIINSILSGNEEVQERFIEVEKQYLLNNQ